MLGIVLVSSAVAVVALGAAAIWWLRHDLRPAASGALGMVVTPHDAGMSKSDARRFVEHVMHDRVGRDLSAPDYDRLADAVIRLRTASHALEAPASTAEQAAQRQAMQTALADIGAISGLPPSELTSAFADDER
jgi:hypothetical protein